MRSVLRRNLAGLPLLFALVPFLSGCKHSQQQRDSVVVLIENSPTSLDPRIGVDAQSEHIFSLIFDGLVRRDEHFNVEPWLAASWEYTDLRTIIFHLRKGVRFQNGQPLTSKDVKWTFDSIMTGAVITAKAGTYASLESIDAPDPQTVIFHLKKPDNSLLPSLADGAIGIVPAGSDRNFWRHPVGTGPFRFVRHEVDKEVVLERNPDSWQSLPHIQRVTFAVVPDAITRALELEKGSADVAINSLTPDMVETLHSRSQLVIATSPGTVVNYIGFNTRDAVLKDARVRRAIAFSINRPLIIKSLWRGHARLANSVLPEQHWAWNGDITRYSYDPAEANRILDAAGYRRQPDGMRFHLTMKTSTDEVPRLLAMIFQQELRQVGIELDIRTYEFASFFADITRGTFQMYTLRWLGGNEQPDIFGYAFSTARIPPKGANRGHYLNPALDALVDDAAQTPDQQKRIEDYRRIQQILAEDQPAINLWYLDTIMVHSRRLMNIRVSPSGDYDFLRDARLQP
jgi:peptide/nickel transport system substrate-binding protein